jgi:hypothetical protein
MKVNQMSHPPSPAELAEVQKIVHEVEIVSRLQILFGCPKLEAANKFAAHKHLLAIQLQLSRNQLK